MIYLKKITYSDLPESVQNAITLYEPGKISINETLLTANQLDKLKEFFQQDGWKVDLNP